MLPSAWHSLSSGHHLQLDPGTHVSAFVQESHSVNVLQFGLDCKPEISAYPEAPAMQHSRKIAETFIAKYCRAIENGLWLQRCDAQRCDLIFELISTQF
jgi:hypothetical protein